jgi:hypothetical protein
MKRRDELIGFKLKGFKNYYIKHLSGLHDFVTVVTILENEISRIANEAFDDRDAEREKAYRKARAIAERYNVQIKDLPVKVAAR